MAEFKDKLGRVLAVGDIVAYRQHVYMELGRVVKLTNKRMTVRILHPQYRHESYQRSGEVIYVGDTPEVTTWIMRGCP